MRFALNIVEHQLARFGVDGDATREEKHPIVLHGLAVGTHGGGGLVGLDDLFHAAKLKFPQYPASAAHVSGPEHIDVSQQIIELVDGQAFLPS